MKKKCEYEVTYFLFCYICNIFGPVWSILRMKNVSSNATKGFENGQFNPSDASRVYICIYGIQIWNMYIEISFLFRDEN